MIAELTLLLLVSGFEPPSQGEWICPDGHVNYFADPVCRPKELKGAWWEQCVAGRDDCIWAEHAYIGMDYEHGYPHSKYGPGYCYWKQPTTCGRSP